jgi:hypothetical protein
VCICICISIRIKVEIYLDLCNWYIFKENVCVHFELKISQNIIMVKKIKVMKCKEFLNEYKWFHFERWIFMHNIDFKWKLLSISITINYEIFFVYYQGYNDFFIMRIKILIDSAIYPTNILSNQCLGILLNVRNEG